MLKNKKTTTGEGFDMDYKYLAFDIETAPSKRGLMYINDVAPIKVDSRLKDPDKIKQAKELSKQKMIDKAALYWWTGKIHTICVNALDTDEEVTFQDLASEQNVLTSFFTYLLGKKNYILIGKSSASFDRPYVVGRAISHDLGLPPQLREGRPISDIDQVFGYKNEQQTTLNNYAFGMGIPMKTMSGCQVIKLYEEGEQRVIEEYCKHDVFITVELLRRYYKPFRLHEHEDNQVSVEGLFN